LLLIFAVGCRKARVEVRPDEKPGLARVTCKLPDTIGAATVPARCDLTIDKVVNVPAGSSLDIAAGARLTFAKGAGLVLQGGTLRARGTAEEPIVFTSATRVAGDWTGIVFTHRPFDRSPRFVKTSDAGADADVPPDSASLLEHVVVEYGGARAEAVPAYHKGTAGIYVRPLVGDTVSLSHVKVHDNVAFDLWVDGPLYVTKLEAISFGTGKVRVPTDYVAGVAGNSGGTVVLQGTVTSSITLPKRTYVIDGYSGVTANAGPATMEIEKGSTIQFEKLADLTFNGTKALAKLIAHDVLFTSAEPKPSAGDWRNIVFTGDAAADLDGCIFEFAGAPGFGAGAGLIRLPADEKAMRVVNSTFRNNDLAAFETMNACKPWEDPALKNSSTGKPICEPSPLLKMFAPPPASIGVLGALTTKGTEIDDLFGPSAELGKVSLGSAGVLGGPGGGVGGGSVALPTSKVVESSITASGPLPVDVVRKGVRARTGSLRACHGGKGSGTITVSFAIDAGGSVTSAKVTGGTLTDASVRSCVESVFSGASFPPAETAGTTKATATHEYL